ncbi:hypothetical protein BKA62DRAFT_212818 [Auriculariales sp. MPI-PUGE-AT-0066]|nr:hypothetical protein BKA62DRAFT_212818 [Auriculariales sp. MPI-PUGE-AT-0066]
MSRPSGLVMRLPIELFDMVFQHLRTAELNAFAQTAHFARAMTIQRMYSYIVFRNSPTNKVLGLLHNLWKNKTLALYVVHLELDWIGKSDESVNVASKLAAVLPMLRNLVHLTVSKAIEIYTWAFDAVTLPSLRELHAHQPLNASFLDRHPQLRKASIMLPTFGREPYADTNLSELEVLSLINPRGDSNDLLRICSDGNPRPNLRRIDWQSHGQNLTPSDMTRMQKVASYVRQVNYLDENVAIRNFVLNPPWESVVRIGLRIPRQTSSSRFFEQHLAGFVRQSCLSFPNIHTVDLLSDSEESLSPFQMTTIKRSVKVLRDVHQVLTVTGDGMTYERKGRNGSFVACQR